MNLLKYIFLYLVFMYSLTSCGDGGATIGGITSGIYVSQEKGSDLGTGKQDSPYKTISYALLHDTRGLNNIYVTGGNYTTENGEIFPLILKKDINISHIKENPEDTSTVLISGYGSHESDDSITIILNGNNQLKSLTIDSNDNIGILSKQGDNEVLNSILVNNKVAIGSINNSKITLKDTSIKNNTYAGIEGSNNSIINLISSKIYSNNIGIILFDNSKLEFEHNQSSQNNEIQKNNLCDFLHQGKNNIQLKEIKWDDDVFDFTVSKECSNGNNIVNTGSATIDYQHIPSRNSTIFSANKIINIISPNFGDTIFSTTPDFAYNATGNKLIMIALWNNPPIVRDNIIINAKDIVWYWHTGMNNSPIGYVSYNSGRIPIDGNVNPLVTSSTNSSQPLEKGRSYYFAVWEWDEKGINIIGSSNISYFITAP